MKGQGLSIQAIVIMILALTVLVLGILFITGTLQKILGVVDEWPIPEQEPTPDDPIQFLPARMSIGDNKFTVAFYNNGPADISSSEIPGITCEGLGSLSIRGSGIDIPVSEKNSYALIVIMPETEKQTYPCTISLGTEQKTFFLEVA